jgi:hypothetical protein
VSQPAGAALGDTRLPETEDLSGSPLWNPDLAPTRPERRTWSTYNIAALWIGMSVVITTYTLASGLMQQGMRWWQAMLTILLGNTVVLVPMVLNAHAGTKYGIPFPVLCRASFGVRAPSPAVLRALVACGWFGIRLDRRAGAGRTPRAAWPGGWVPGGMDRLAASGDQVAVILEAPRIKRSSWSALRWAARPATGPVGWGAGRLLSVTGLRGRRRSGRCSRRRSPPAWATGPR